MEKVKTKKKRDILPIIVENKAIFIFLILFIIASLMSDKFLGIQNLRNVLRQISVNCVLGFGFTFVLAAGYIDLSVGLLLSLCGVVAALVSKSGVPFVVAILVAILVGIIGGLLNATAITKLSIPSFMATLALAQGFKGASYLISNTSTVVGLPEGFRIIGQEYLFNIPVSVYIFVAIGIICMVILGYTKFGRHVIAVGGNAEAAKVSGISTTTTCYGVFILMGICCAVGSLMLTGRSMAAQPAAGEGMEMDIIAAVVIGGTSLNGGHGNVIGTIFGCLIMGIINNMLNLAGVNTSWQLVAKCVIIILAMVIDVLSNYFYQKRDTKAE